MSSPNRAAAFLLALFAVIVAVALVRGGGPAPKPATAPSSEFSAVRAIDTLREVVGDKPHPLGSAEHDAVRDRIVARFHSLGYDTHVQHAFTCDAHGVCATVDNIIARMPYAPAGDALALTAHYDSVAAGPGASDDGVGVAALLEIARAIRTAPMRNALVFVITDGEELGLLGATAFVDDPNVSHNVAAVINVDNRGTSGPSYLFETSVHNAWLLPIVASKLPRPSSSSLFFDIYQMLPNDTDMTVFKAAGKQGLNFANIGGVTNYHAPLDNLAHVTASTVQDHGDHALAMARALGNTELRQVSSMNATWFDVLGLAIFWWPAGWTMPIAVLALILVVIAAMLRMREDAVRARQITWGVVAFFLSLFVAFLIALVLTFVAAARARGMSWVAWPLPSVLMAWLGGIGAAIAMASLLRRRAGDDGLLLGAALSWSVLAVATATVLPGGSYIFLIPAVAIAVCAVLRAFLVDVAELTAGAVMTLLTSVLVVPLALSFYTALGVPLLAAVAAIVALAATAFAPVIAGAPLRRPAIFAFLGGAVVCAIIALCLPAATRSVPRRLDIDFVGDPGRPIWTATAPLGNTFRRQTATWAPWNPRPAWAAPASPVALPTPTLHVVSDVRSGRRTVTLHLHSNRNAWRIALAFHTVATVDSIRINGVVIPPRTDRRSPAFAPNWRRVVVAAPDADVEIGMRSVRVLDFVVSDYTPGLPPAGASLARARDDANGVPSDGGDETVAMTKARL